MIALIIYLFVTYLIGFGLFIIPKDREYSFVFIFSPLIVPIYIGLILNDLDNED